MVPAPARAVGPAPAPLADRAHAVLEERQPNLAVDRPLGVVHQPEREPVRAGDTRDVVERPVRVRVLLVPQRDAEALGLAARVEPALAVRAREGQRLTAQPGEPRAVVVVLDDVPLVLLVAERAGAVDLQAHLAE